MLIQPHAFNHKQACDHHSTAVMGVIVFFSALRGQSTSDAWLLQGELLCPRMHSPASLETVGSNTSQAIVEKCFAVFHGAYAILKMVKPCIDAASVKRELCYMFEFQP